MKNTRWTIYKNQVAYQAPERWIERRSLQQPARTSTKLLIAVIGIAVFVAFGVYAGFIER